MRVGLNTARVQDFLFDVLGCLVTLVGRFPEICVGSCNVVWGNVVWGCSVVGDGVGRVCVVCCVIRVCIGCGAVVRVV